MTSKYDVVIVGARAAGAGAAAFLALHGFRVLLVDRSHHLSPPISCPLFFANTLDRLRHIGALDTIQGLGAPRLYLHQTIIGDIHLSGRALPYRGIDYALQIRRERFDQVLLEHVASMPGVESRLGFNVTDVIWNDARNKVIGVEGHSDSGLRERVLADAVIGADGIHSSIARRVEAKPYNLLPARTCVFYAYYSNFGLSAKEPNATVYISLQDKFAFITANSDSDLTVLSLSLPTTLFESARHELDQVHCRFAALLPPVGDRLVGARRETPIRVMAPRNSFYRVPYGPGWVLVGDAAYHKDPLTGQGIYDALRSAELAAQAYANFVHNGSTTQAWQNSFRCYQLTRDKETGAMYELTDYYAQLDRTRSPLEIQAFRAMSRMADWSDRYMSVFSGSTPADEFLRRSTTARVLATWYWRQLLGRVTGKAVGNRS